MDQNDKRFRIVEFHFFLSPAFSKKSRGTWFLAFRHSVRPSFRPVLPSFRPPIGVCTLCAQLLLQFYSDSFETSQMFRPCFEDVHVVWILSSDQCFTLFSQFEPISHFSDILTTKVNGQWVPRVRNSSYSFIQILFKLYRCLYHALKICTWFGYNPQINFSHFFRNLNLVIFQVF